MENLSQSAQRTRSMLAVLTAALAVVMFLFMGNSHEPRLFGPSIVSWLVKQWQHPDSRHCWLIPPIALYFVWRKRKELLEALKGSDETPCAPDRRAIPIIALLLFLYWAGYRAQQPRLGVLCLIGLCWAVPFYVAGLRFARYLVFPCAFLLFAVPMGFLVSFTFPLRLFACKASVFLLNGFGIGAARSGTMILGESGRFLLHVDDPCSGLNSLVALAPLAAGYGHISQNTLLKKWILFLCAVPIAIAGNIVRIMVIAAAGQWFGAEVADRIYHKWSGYIVFVTAVLLLIGLGSLLKKRMGRGMTYLTERTEDTKKENATAGVTSADKVGAGHAYMPISADSVCSVRYGLQCRRGQTEPYAVLSALFLATIAAVRFVGASRYIADLGIKLNLPSAVGKWKGHDVFSCQNEKCRAQFMDTDLTNGVACPLCDGSLDSVSLAERKALPSDTLILKKRYRDQAGHDDFFVTIVVTSTQRSSIHRAHWCLPGQGYAIESEEARAVPLPDGAKLPVMLLRLSRRSREPSGFPRCDALYAYWFVGGGRATPYHWQRLLWMASDSVLKGASHRWAYVTVSTDASPDERAAENQLAEFVAAFHRLVTEQ